MGSRSSSKKGRKRGKETPAGVREAPLLLLPQQQGRPQALAVRSICCNSSNRAPTADVSDLM